MTSEFADRFFAKVDRNGPVPAHCPELGPCHVWTGCRARTPMRYGDFRFQGRLVTAHRVAFFIAHARWPDPCCLHRCDNPACVNPKHLFEGTDADNARDRDAKGRQVSKRGIENGSHTKPHRRPRGERSGNSKLTDAKVRSIRERYAAGGVTQRELAREHGVDFTLISLIVRKKAWRHVLDDSAAEELARLRERAPA